MPRSLLLLAVTLIAATGCAYHGALQPQQLHQAPAVQGEIPLRVALVVAEPFRSQRLVFTTLNVREIDLNPGLTDLIATSLRGLFREVIVVDGARAVDTDLLVYPAADVQRFRPVVLTLAFRDPRTQAEMGSYDAATNVNWADPPEANMAAFLTGFSLFTLSPLTLAWEAQASGDNAIARAQQGIAQDLQVISARIRSDASRLVAAVRQQSIDEWAKACDQRDDLSRRIQGCTELIARAAGRPGLQASAYAERAAAHLQARDLDRASADVAQALLLDPRHIWAIYYRGRIAQTRHQYERAARDYDESAALIEASVAARPDPRLRESGLAIRERAREMEIRGALEQRWVRYLEAIQASGDYANWSAPPYDLYREGRR